MKRANFDGMEHAQMPMAKHIHRIPEEDFQKYLEALKKKKKGKKIVQTMETILKGPKP
jgi:heme/copper-type cytochrome/quinol oxidase subunit 2